MFPDALHRVCHVHFLRYLNFQLPKTRRSKYHWRNKTFVATVKAIVKAPARDEAEALLALKSFHKLRLDAHSMKVSKWIICQL